MSNAVLLGASLVSNTGIAVAAQINLPEIPHYELSVPPRVEPLNQPHDQPDLQYTYSEQRGTEHIPFVVKVIPAEPSPQSEEREKSKAEQDRKLADFTGDLASYTKLLFGATAALALATFGLAIVAYRQMRDGRESIKAAVRLATVSEDTAVRQLRAYITLREYRPTPRVISPINLSVDAWRIVPIWENAGLTPIKNSVTHCNWLFFSRGDSPEELGFPDYAGPGSTSVQVTIGPRSTIEGETLIIPIDVIWMANALEGRIFLWGWLEYDDAFANETPRRRTEFCVYLRWDGSPDAPNPEHVSFPHYRIFNGADEECYHQPAPRQRAHGGPLPTSSPPAG